MLSLFLFPFRLALLLVGVVGALVLVPLVETIVGIVDEWALAFRQARSFVRATVA